MLEIGPKLINFITYARLYVVEEATVPTESKYYFFLSINNALTSEETKVIAGEVQIKNVVFVLQYCWWNLWCGPTQYLVFDCHHTAHPM